jgi:hypothetical protein
MPVERHARQRRQPSPQPFPQRGDAGTLHGALFDRDAAGRAHAHHLVSGQGPRAQATFLAAAVQQRHQAKPRFAPHAQDAHALRPVQLVRGQCQQVDAVALDVDRQLPGALSRVDVEQDAARAAQSPDRPDVLDDTDLVVHVHQRDEDRVRAQRRLDLAGSDDAVRTRLEVGDLEPLALELAAGGQHRRVFGPRGHEVPPARLVEARRAEQREVVGFRGTGGPDDLRRIGADERGDLGTRLLHAPVRAPAGLVRHGGRVGEVALRAEAIEHRRHDTRVDRRRGCVVEIDDGAHVRSAPDCG